MARQLCEEKSREIIASSSSTGLFCYSTDHVNIQGGFVSDSDPAEMFNLTTSMEMIGFPKNLHLQNDAAMPVWKTFLAKPAAAGPSSSSSKTMNQSSSNNFYHQQQQQDFPPAAGASTLSVSEATTSDQNLIVHDSTPWQQENNKLLVDHDSSLSSRFVLQRPSQGLSLSLSSTSNIGLQSFELRQSDNHQISFQDGFLMNTKAAAASANIYHQQQFLLKNSKFLLPLQDLLNEFCSLGTKQNDLVPKLQKSNKEYWPWPADEDDNGTGNSSMKHSLSSLELVELHKRKTKLLSMLEEVERRYRHYCNQMKAVVSSFEAVAGNGAAIVYSTLALKAMSKHFRCLKDGILDQIQVTRKAVGEKDTVNVSPGATKGETPRLKILDRALRQQRVFQQINMMETHPWRPQRGLPERSVSILRAWLFEHFLHPYPSDVDKHILARQTGLTRSQVSNWFINARVRLWKPMVEEMYLEEEKEQQQRNATTFSEGGANNEEDITNHTTNVLQNPSPTQIDQDDQKPTTTCVSSIINNTDHKNGPKILNPLSLARVTDPFGSVDLDFSSYTLHSSDVVNQSFHGGGGGVSLTLGLQQHGGSGGVSLAFPPPATVQSPMFFTRDLQIDHHEEQCQTVHQYSSLLDGEGQNMQYRNLKGKPLLHDLA